MINEALYALLAGNATLMAELTGGVSPVFAEEATPPPYLVYQQVSSLPREVDFHGPQTLAQERWQLDIYAETYAAAQQIKTLLRQQLHGYKGESAGVRIHGIFLDSINDIFNERPGLYRIAMDFMVHYKEA